jgi:hypothetical protein
MLLVASETPEAIKPTNFTTSPATTTATAATTTTTITTTAAAAATATTTTTAAPATIIPDKKQHLEHKTTPNLVQPEPKTSTTEAPLFKYKTTDFTHSTNSTEMIFMTDHSQLEDKPTKQHPTQWLNHGQQSTDTVTSSTLHVRTNSSASFPEPSTSSTIFERYGISNHSESKTATPQQSISGSDTNITGTEDPIKNLATPDYQSVFTTDTESTTSHSGTNSSTQYTVDRSTATYNATSDITDTESTTPTNLLTSSSSPRPDIQPIDTVVITNTSTDSAAITGTSATSGTDATDSSVFDSGDGSPQSVSAEPLTDISMILTTTDGQPHMSVTGPTTAAVTNSSMSIQHSPTASDETSVMSQSYKSQKIIADATVAPG